MASLFRSDLLASLIPPTHPNLHPIPGTLPLTPIGAALPPLIYYVGLLFLPPPPPPFVRHPFLILLRHTLALIAAFLFFRLPLRYHVPQSIGLTYQLGLVGFYGGCRVIDVFFISPYIFGHIPRRVSYHHRERKETIGEDGPQSDPRGWSNREADGVDQETDETSTNDGYASFKQNGISMSDLTENTPRRLSLLDSGIVLFPSTASTISSTATTLSRMLTGPDSNPVYETATTHPSYPTSLVARASYAFDLMLSMRGTGFTWTTADVRHTRKTWLPTVTNRVHSISVHAMPVLLFSWYIISSIYATHLRSLAEADQLFYTSAFDTLSYPTQFALTASLGAFLMAAFSLGHSLSAILLSPLASHPSLSSLAFFPPLYSTRIWDITSVRGFWSFGWHRLFARLFLVYGVWPGEWVERKLTGKPRGSRADLGKIIGGFLSSAVVHSMSVRGVLGGNFQLARGEAVFFVCNGIAVAVEGVLWECVKASRRRRMRKVHEAKRGGNGKGVVGEGDGRKKNCQGERVLGFEKNYHDDKTVEEEEKNDEEKGLTRWYDPIVGRVWWITVLLLTGRNFARGWVRSGLVREMAFM